MAIQLRTNSGVTLPVQNVSGLEPPGHRPPSLVSAFSFEVQTPYDVATGHASGKRQHKPIVLLMQRSAWLASGLQPGRTFASLQFESTDSSGTPSIVKLHNVSVDSVKHGSTASNELVEIKFAFQQIQFTWTSGGKTTKDDWTK